jgi:AraC-like DNA-binding protein
MFVAGRVNVRVGRCRSGRCWFVVVIEEANMSFSFEERPSDVPLVQTVWRTQSERAGAFDSVAVSRWEMVLTRRKGRTTLSVRGPETSATRATIPSHATFFGIVFNHGAFMPLLPAAELVDGAVNLPQAGSNCFWLHGSAWRFPSFDNADTFVRRLMRAGLLVYDPVVDEALRGRPVGLSPRSVRRRVVRATGLTPGVIRQIDRARQATALLQRGVSILDTMNDTAYFDQPHLTRALKRFMGHTPAELLRMNGFADMSLSYKTAEFSQAMQHSKTRR